MMNVDSIDELRIECFFDGKIRQIEGSVSDLQVVKRRPSKAQG